MRLTMTFWLWRFSIFLVLNTKVDKWFLNGLILPVSLCWHFLSFKSVISALLTQHIWISVSYHFSKAFVPRLKLYGIYLLAVKTLCRKFTKFSPRTGQPTETQFCFLSWLFYLVFLNFWFRHRMIPDYFSMWQVR